MKMIKEKHYPFAIGDIVYILAKYVPDPCAPLLLLECKISHVEHRQFVAYRTDGGAGIWRFSKKHYDKCVFKDKSKAAEAWSGRADNGRNG